MRSRKAIFLIGVGILLSFSQWSGAQWKACGPGGNHISIDSLVVSEPYIFVGTCEGIILSTNRGQSWNFINSGLPVDTEANCLTVSGLSIFAGTNCGVWRLPLSDVSIKKR